MLCESNETYFTPFLNKTEVLMKKRWEAIINPIYLLSTTKIIY